MKKHIAGISLIVSVALAAPLLSAAGERNTIEDAIYYRQAAYAFLSWNMGKIKAQVIDGTVAFDAAQVQASANAIAATANAGMGALYPAGSDKGKGFHETKVKPEFFTRSDDVAELARKFNMAANNLAEVAASGDKAAIAKAFGEVGQSCKGCHDQFRNK